MTTRAHDDWARYWRAPDRPLEAMHAHFSTHVYARHSHDAYSFGFTEAGAQRFSCRGGAHTSAAGLLMAFNPDDPHDGRAAAELGYRFRMVHIGPELVREVPADATGRRGPMPLFTAPVLHAEAAGHLLRLLSAPAGGADPLVRDERLTDAVTAMVRRGASGPVPGRRPRRAGRRPCTRRAPGPRPAAGAVRRADPGAGTGGRGGAEQVRAVPGGSAPRTGCRRATTSGCCGCGGAGSCWRAGSRRRRRRWGPGPDQPHFHRWFVRYYGVTPGTYQRAALSGT
ncbi:AraC family ligand binding domain-containing protein [Streptomyces sp. NPDC001970]